MDDIGINDFAFKLFEIRKNSKKQVIDNTKLHAGEPMYFYCKHCGILCDVVEEQYLFTPYEVCSQCKGMEERGWL